MSERDSQLCTRGLFLAMENVSHINSRLRFNGKEKIRKHQLAGWYDEHMRINMFDKKMIENVITWQHFMTENYIREFKGYHTVASEEVPFLPFAENGERNQGMIQQTRSDGKYPKFKLQSAVEDKRDQNGNIVIRNVHATTRMFANTKKQNKRFGKTPHSFYMNGSRLIDRDDRGSLYDWEPLHRPHTKRDMTIFMTGVNKKEVPQMPRYNYG
jgi:hypothetical protein